MKLTKKHLAQNCAIKNFQLVCSNGFFVDDFPFILLKFKTYNKKQFGFVISKLTNNYLWKTPADNLIFPKYK